MLKNVISFIIALLVLILWNEGFGQGNFSISIPFASNHGADAGFCIEAFREDFILASGSICKESGLPCIGLLRVEPNGSVVWKKMIGTFEEGLSLGGPNAMEVFDKNIFVSGDFLSTPVERDLKFLKLSEEGDTVWTKIYSRPFTVENLGLTNAPDSGFLIYSQQYTEVDNRFHKVNVIKTNFSGYKEWEINHSLDNWWWATPIFATISSSNFFVLTSLIDTLGGGRATQPVLTILTDSGEIHKERSFAAIEFESPNAYSFPTGEGFVLFWAEDHSNDPYKTPYPPTVIGLNKNFDEQWRFTFEDTVLTDRMLLNVKPLKNGDFLGIGYAYDFNLLSTLGWIFRIARNGQLKWTRLIQDDRPGNSSFFFWDAEEGQDGSFYISGSIDTTYVDTSGIKRRDPNIWLVKLDSSGCFAPNCGEYQFLFDTTIASNTEFERTNIEKRRKVFPNPFSKKLHIQQKASTIRSITISNNIGRVVFTKSMEAFEELLTIDLSDVSPGLYFLGAYDSKGRLIWNEKICKIE